MYLFQIISQTQKQKDEALGQIKKYKIHIEMLVEKTYLQFSGTRVSISGRNKEVKKSDFK